MCGIAGIVSADGRPVELRRLLAIRESMQHRGPDGAGFWISDDGTVGLAHRRLAILDLSERAAQPMASADGAVQIVFNGEIYNHPELRKWAESHGAKYRTASDTETLLHLYALEGDVFIRRLRGMFAFALWDTRQRRLLMARDPFGIKPLYYCRDGDQMTFASQAKALLAGGVSDRVSLAGVASFYLWGYVTEPHTWYQAIRALPAGTLMSWHPGSPPEFARHCDPLVSLRSPTPPSREASTLKAALLDSIRHHLLADVPVGLFLSAGIDSGTLLALAAESGDAHPLHTITLAFDEYAGTPRDEAPFASELAERFGAQHRVIRYGRTDFVGERTALLSAMDQPTIDGVNTYFVSRSAAQSGIKAAISGIGGDELFGGYPSFEQIPALVRSVDWVPERVGRVARGVLFPLVTRLTSPKLAGVLEYGSDVGGAYLLRRALFMPWELPALMGEQQAADGLGELDVMRSLGSITEGIADPYDQVMALEISIYLRNCLLRDADWAGMAHSLEIRTPLVDAELFSQLMALRRVRGGAAWSKRDLALASARSLPDEILERPKTGFNVPVRDWLLNEASGAQRRARAERGLRGWARVVAAGAGFGGPTT